MKIYDYAGLIPESFKTSQIYKELNNNDNIQLYVAESHFIEGNTSFDGYGYFKNTGANSGIINISYFMNRDPVVYEQTIAHELAHAYDYFTGNPDHGSHNKEFYEQTYQDGFGANSCPMF